MDLYALGVVLYELATGSHPFGDAEVSVMIARHLHETPRPAGELNPQLSPFLEEFLKTLLEKDRDLRLASAAEAHAIVRKSGSAKNKRVDVVAMVNPS